MAPPANGYRMPRGWSAAADGSAPSPAQLGLHGRLTRGRLTDRSLIQAAQGGSEEALEALFRRHWREAHRAAFLVVRDAQAAEDIAQEAFLSAIRSLDRFDRARSFAPWLHRIVVNRAIDWSRARRLRGEVGIDSMPARVVEDPTTQPEPPSEIGLLLDQLVPEHRAVVVLRYLLDYTPGEISAMLDIPRGTVNSRLRRALDRLGARLDEGAR